MYGEECLEQLVDGGVGVEANGGFVVGTPGVFNEKGKVLEVESDLHGTGAVSCGEGRALKVPTGNFDVV